jgi:hypothetical protein
MYSTYDYTCKVIILKALCSFAAARLAHAEATVVKFLENFHSLVRYDYFPSALTVYPLPYIG